MRSTHAAIRSAICAGWLKIVHAIAATEAAPAIALKAKNAFFMRGLSPAADPDSMTLRYPSAGLWVTTSSRGPGEPILGVGGGRFQGGAEPLSPFRYIQIVLFR